MLAMPPDAEPERLLHQVAWEWLRLLASGQADRAMAMLDEPNSYGHLWSPDQLERVIRDAFGHTGRPLAVTAPDAVEGSDRFSCIRLKDGSGYSVELALPLDGAWSDLTVQLEFLGRPGALAMVLHDVHVL
jgi:hypothetical protein